MTAGTKSLPDACYTAEGTVLQPVARRFNTMRELEAFVTDLTTSDWWIENFPAAVVGVQVEARSSTARFSLSHGEWISIANNPMHRTMATVLHELAHAATANADGHGPIFRSAMIKLVRKEMGFYAAVDLENEYRRVMQ